MSESDVNAPDELARRERELPEKEIELHRGENNIIKQGQIRFSPREVEETLPCFNGTNMPIENFVKSMEENGILYS